MTARASVTAGAGAGTGATATIANFSDDEIGEITITAAGTPGAVDTIVAQIKLSNSWSGFNERDKPRVKLVPVNKAAARVGSWDFTLDGAWLNIFVYCSAVLTAGTVYVLQYEIRG